MSRYIPLQFVAAGLVRRMADMAARLPARIAGLAALARSRRSLAKLDHRLIRDVGLTDAQAKIEAGRPRWDAPLHWRG